ncbi:enoyl-CoA hydratase/isomerase family protein [Aeromicrobium sp. CTD01-1L150]|uniref:enoyl-CoA hydratase/isomerase family protein n=1 Tax=Aeromicrobium sp. CTD01-1L150 TaxID=3341830 RepID=UPI0035C1B608
MATPEPTVLLQVHNGVGTMTLNRPERRNAISWQLVLELISALEAALADPAVRAIVLTGAGRDFCVGADMAKVGSADAGDHETRTLRGHSVEDDEERLTHASSIVEMLTTSDKPTVAAIDGACAGAGLSLALATDLQIASGRAVFNTAFIGAAVPGDFGSAWLLARAVGPARARSLLLDPGRMPAHEAAALGLVTEVSDDLESRVHDLANKLAHQAPRAMVRAKENLRDAVTPEVADYLRQEVPRMVDCARSDDARQAARAFIEKRTPVFTGE